MNIHTNAGRLMQTTLTSKSAILQYVKFTHTEHHAQLCFVDFNKIAEIYLLGKKATLDEQHCLIGIKHPTNTPDPINVGAVSLIGSQNITDSGYGQTEEEIALMEGEK